MTTKILERELTECIEPIAFEKGYHHYRVLVRSNQQPLGWISFSLQENESIAAEELLQLIKTQLGHSIIQQALSRSFQESNAPASNEAISVVVCTRNRTASLAHCLQSLLSQKYSNYEIIVVDNAPSTDDTMQLAAQLPVRYVREERPGLDWARNRGIAEAQYNIIAFTDDDVRVDANWLQAAANAFSNKEVMAACGYVAPAQLETPAQRLFELNYGGMGHGFQRRVLKKEKLSQQQLIWTSSFGVGANMAFRKEVFQKIGMFDTALDVGTPSHGGGDIELFHRVVAKGYTLVYDPCMLVWHYHRRDNAALRRQIFDNGRSFGCYLIHCYRTKTVSRFAVVQFFFMDWLLKWNLKNLIGRRSKIPKALSLMELRGMLTSPFAYWQTKKQNRRISRDFSKKDTMNK